MNEQTVEINGWQIKNTAQTFSGPLKWWISHVDKFDNTTYLHSDGRFHTSVYFNDQWTGYYSTLESAIECAEQYESP